MRQAYPVIFTQIDDKKNTVLIEVPDLELMTEGFGTADAMFMARDAIGVKELLQERERVIYHWLIWILMNTVVERIIEPYEEM